MWPSREADRCANTPPMRARALLLLHCIANTSLIRAFFSAPVNVICPSEKIMGTLYHNKASPQDKFFQRQKKPFANRNVPATPHACRSAKAEVRCPYTSSTHVLERGTHTPAARGCRQRRQSRRRRQSRGATPDTRMSAVPKPAAAPDIRMPAATPPPLAIPLHAIRRRRTLRHRRKRRTTRPISHVWHSRWPKRTPSGQTAQWRSE